MRTTPSFESLHKLFLDQNKLHGGGCQLTVIQDGAVLYDCSVGVRDKSKSNGNSSSDNNNDKNNNVNAFTNDTLINSASCTKGVTNICVARLVDSGLLDYDAPIVKYWYAGLSYLSR
jgi:CubicO group peptidase (beta-lactamase class C family)